MTTDYPKYLLMGAIGVLSFMLLTEFVAFKTAYEEEQASRKPLRPSQAAQQTAPSAPAPALNSQPQSADALAAPANVPAANAPQAMTTAAVASGTPIRVVTDVLDVTLSSRGGDVVKVSLPKVKASLKEDAPNFTILEREQRYFVAQTGLFGQNGTDVGSDRPVFSSERKNYRLRDGQDTLVVDLYYPQGLVDITKRYTFTRGSHLIELEYLVNNRSNEPWKASLLAQLVRDNSQDPGKEGSGMMMGMNPFLGVAWNTPEERYNKVRFDKMRDKPVKVTQTDGWIAIVQHYFVTAWIGGESNNSYDTVVANGNNVARMVTPPLQVAPGESGTVGAKLYSGPKDQYKLAEIAKGLDLSVDYSFLWWIAQPLFWLLTKIYSFVGNWGLAIIGVTLTVKILFFQLNAKAFKSMANMRKVQPKLLALRERYADDKAKQSQAMMELYKKEKINPLGGCLPMLVQMPVFIALYWVLMESVELRHAEFLWLKDLSAMDPYFVLPLLMGASMFIQQKLNPPPPDPMQAKIMQWLPVIFTFFFLFFPSGLVLYWVVNNVLSIAQQWVITKNIEKGDAKPA